MRRLTNLDGYEDQEPLEAALVGDDGWDDEDLIILIIAYGLEEARRIRVDRRYETRLYLTRPELMYNPRYHTPWQKLFASQTDRAFITTMGLDVATFFSLCDAGFEAHWNENPIPRNDVQPVSVPRLTRRSLDAFGALGLALHFLNSTMVEMSLCEIFALIPTTVSRYLSFALEILLKTLREMQDAQIRWPRGDEFQHYSDLVTARHPLLVGAFGSIDGLKLPVQTPSDPLLENSMYNGWLHDHFIGSVFAFSVVGEIISCNLNCPGSWHDARVAMPIYEQLYSDTPKEFFLAADTAFPAGTNRIAGRIKTPMKAGAKLPSDPTQRSQVLRFNAQLTSFRQTAEWGMRSIQGSFGRLRVPMQINNDEQRANLLEICARLFNLRTRTVGYNQIKSVYEPLWQDGDERAWMTFERTLLVDQRRGDRVQRYHRS